MVGTAQESTRPTCEEEDLARAWLVAGLDTEAADEEFGEAAELHGRRFVGSGFPRAAVALGLSLVVAAGAALGYWAAVFGTTEAPGSPGGAVTKDDLDGITQLHGAECAATDSECSDTIGCCNPEDTCYRKSEFWASCRASCDPYTPDEFDDETWSCDIVEGTAAEAEEDAGPNLPLCPDPSDKACLKEKCSVSDGGKKGDCLKTWCCSAPGAQCFQQNDYWAGCKPICNKSEGWSCKELGPRTPGDNHAWQPCAVPEEKFPLLLDGDVEKAWEAAEGRAKTLLETLELEDKVALCLGQNDDWPNDRHGYAGYINPNSYFRNKCAMPLMLNDGPQGYNHYQKELKGTTTQFPCLLAVAASFDPMVAKDYAEAIAEEFVAKGANVMLGPDVEVARNPLSGRSFETLSGEDPFLGSQLVAPFVKETLKKGIIVTVKHWLNNNEEDYRMTMNVNVADRAQYEIHMPVFKAAFDAGAGAIMCAYNKVSNVSACENPHLLKKLLREGLGFRGFVMSDWGATHSAERSARHGLDVEMPGGQDGKFGKLVELVKAGKLSEETIDSMAGHVLTAMYAAGHFDGKFKFDTGEAALDSNVTSDKHRAIARKTIIESAVLLKNNNRTLPLQVEGKKIALVGKYCKQIMEKSYGQGDVFSGGGSGWVMTNLTISPLAGVRARFGEAAQVVWSATGTEAEVQQADISVVCAAGHAEEGWDRANLKLPDAQELVAVLRKASKKQSIVVVAIIPGSVTTEWLEHADAGLALFMPGEQVGPAVAELLVGAASPGGRLPVSLPEPDEKRFVEQQYPGLPFNDINMTADWSEGVLVGYRWNDAKKKPAAFPFGFGLSYGTFEFKNFQATCTGAGTVSVTFQTTNIGLREGTVVPQLYVGFASLRPALRQLRGFIKIKVVTGLTADVQFGLNSDDWSTWDSASDTWVSAVERNELVTLHIGTSSAEFVWTQELQCLTPGAKPAAPWQK